MTALGISPFVVLIVSFLTLWVSARVGSYIRRRIRKLGRESESDLSVVLTATLTLLGLIIGFTFSMAISRYDQRKNYEEEEANAIGTEFLRADLLPASDAQNVRALLTKYLELRVLFYSALDPQRLRQVNENTAQLQTDMWTAVRTSAAAQPTPIAALAVAGMNDVLNSQGYTQAAWWNHIPHAAWALMGAIAICSNLLLGYSFQRADTEPVLLLVLPLLVSISFLLIADIDSPRGGVIRVRPQNLISLSQSLHPR